MKTYSLSSGVWGIRGTFVAPAVFVPVRITDNPNIQIEPALDGPSAISQGNSDLTMNRIHPKNHWDINLYDLTMGIEQRITTNPKEIQSARISPC